MTGLIKTKAFLNRFKFSILTTQYRPPTDFNQKNFFLFKLLLQKHLYKINEFSSRRYNVIPQIMTSCTLLKNIFFGVPHLAGEKKL
jgi:hypothetical protein